MNKGLFLLSVLGISACDFASESEPMSCRSSENAVFASAWEEQLQLKNIPFKRKNLTTLCYPKKLNSEVHEARFAAEAVYRGAATIARSEAERLALLAWAKEQKRLFQTQQTEAGETFIVIFSRDTQEFEEAQAMFRSIQ